MLVFKFSILDHENICCILTGHALLVIVVLMLLA
uniref:Uncharacterized protein n=1 Tax=Arundo donax TaxID=35708 RepID=A0A0A8Z5V8_ARUDO